MDELIEETLSVARSGTQVEDPYDVPLVELASDAWTVVETDEATYEIVGNRTLEVDPLRRNNSSRTSIATRSNTGARTSTSASDPVTAASSSPTTAPVSPKTSERRCSNRGTQRPLRVRGSALAIVRAIADAHGWQVAITESEAGGARSSLPRRLRTKNRLFDLTAPSSRTSGRDQGNTPRSPPGCLRPR